jgi:hypothetical protein
MQAPEPRGLSGIEFIDKRHYISVHISLTCLECGTEGRDGCITPMRRGLDAHKDDYDWCDHPYRKTCQCGKITAEDALHTASAVFHYSPRREVSKDGIPIMDDSRRFFEQYERNDGRCPACKTECWSYVIQLHNGQILRDVKHCYCPQVVFEVES